MSFNLLGIIGGISRDCFLEAFIELGDERINNIGIVFDCWCGCRSLSINILTNLSIDIGTESVPCVWRYFFWSRRASNSMAVLINWVSSSNIVMDNIKFNRWVGANKNWNVIFGSAL